MWNAKLKAMWSRGAISNMRRSQVVSKAEDALKLVSNAAKALNKLGPHPALKNYAALSAIVLSKLARGMKTNPHSDPNFHCLHINWFKDHLLELCKKRPSTETFQQGSDLLHVVDLWGENVVFSDGEDLSVFFLTPGPVWGDEARVTRERVLHKFGRLIWEEHGRVIEIVKRDKDRSFRAQPWDVGEIFTSPQTEQVSTRLHKFISGGGRRSLLLHGSPGTGKSCMAQALTHTLSWPTLFIDISQLAKVRPEQITSWLHLLRPYAVILDDIDHIKDKVSVLPLIDRINSTTRLFIATANDLSALHVAAVRTGRFDELEEVEQVIAPSSYIPELPEKFARTLDTWPITAIHELRKRIEALGMDCLDVEVARLQARVAANVIEPRPRHHAPVIIESDEDDGGDEDGTHEADEDHEDDEY